MLEIGTVYIHKSRSVGVSFIKSFLQRFNFFSEFHVLPTEFFGQDYLSILTCQVTSIHYFKPPFEEEKIANEVIVFDKWLSDVINLKTGIVSVGVRKKGNAVERQWPRNNIKTLPTFRAPNGMEFCLDEYTGALPNRPPDNSFSAIGGDVLFHNREAFILWLIGNWPTCDGNRSFYGDKLSAKLLGMRRIEYSGLHHDEISNVQVQAPCAALCARSPATQG